MINRYALEVLTPPCSPGAIRFAAHVRFETDIREALPYLNAELDGAQYNPAAPALNWRRDAHHIVFNVHEIAIGNLVDRAEAEALARALDDCPPLLDAAYATQRAQLAALLRSA